MGRRQGGRKVREGWLRATGSVTQAGSQAYVRMQQPQPSVKHCGTYPLFAQTEFYVVYVLRLLAVLMVRACTPVVLIWSQVVLKGNALPAYAPCLVSAGGLCAEYCYAVCVRMEDGGWMLCSFFGWLWYGMEGLGWVQFGLLCTALLCLLGLHYSWLSSTTRHHNTTQAPLSFWAPCWLGMAEAELPQYQVPASAGPGLAPGTVDKWTTVCAVPANACHCAWVGAAWGTAAPQHLLFSLVAHMTTAHVYTEGVPECPNNGTG